MFSRSIPSRTLWAWTAAGCLAPFAWYLGGEPWPWVLGLSGAVGILLILTAARTDSFTPPCWLAAAEWMLVTFTAARAAADVGACWQGAAHPAAFPAVLLALSVCGAVSGTQPGARGGATLLPFAGALFLIPALFALPEVRPEWVRAGMERVQETAAVQTGSGSLTDPSGLGAWILLLPCAGLLLPREKGNAPWLAAFGLTLWAGAVACLTAGVLSPRAAAGTEGAFFQMARGIRIPGVADRFEAVVAAALTLGWYCLLSLLLTAAGGMAERCHPRWGKGGVILSALAAWAIRSAVTSLNPWLLAGLTLLLWLLAPMAMRNWNDNGSLPTEEGRAEP